MSEILAPSKTIRITQKDWDDFLLRHEQLFERAGVPTDCYPYPVWWHSMLTTPLSSQPEVGDAPSTIEEIDMSDPSQERMVENYLQIIQTYFRDFNIPYFDPVWIREHETLLSELRRQCNVRLDEAYHDCEIDIISDEDVTETRFYRMIVSGAGLLVVCAGIFLVIEMLRLQSIEPWIKFIFAILFLVGGSAVFVAGFRWDKATLEKFIDRL